MQILDEYCSVHNIKHPLESNRQIIVNGYFYGNTRNTAVNFPEFITKDNLNIKIHYTQYTVSNASVVRASTSISQTFNLGSITCTEIV